MYITHFSLLNMIDRWLRLVLYVWLWIPHINQQLHKPSIMEPMVRSWSTDFLVCIIQYSPVCVICLMGGVQPVYSCIVKPMVRSRLTDFLVCIVTELFHHMLCGCIMNRQIVDTHWSVLSARRCLLIVINDNIATHFHRSHAVGIYLWWFNRLLPPSFPCIHIVSQPSKQYELRRVYKWWTFSRLVI